MPPSISHSELGIKLANALGLTTQLIVALGGSYRYKKSILNELRGLESAIRGLMYGLPTIDVDGDQKTESEPLEIHRNPSLGRGYSRTEIRIKLSPQEQVHGKPRLTTNDIDTTLEHLADIEACLDLYAKNITGTEFSSKAETDIERAFTCSHKVKELLEMIRPAAVS